VDTNPTHHTTRAGRTRSTSSKKQTRRPARVSPPILYSQLKSRNPCPTHESRNRSDHIRRLIHDDDRTRSQRSPVILQRIVIHQDLFTDIPRDDGDTTTTGDDSLEVLPSSSNASAVTFEHFLEGHGHFLFEHGGSVDVAGYAEELGPVVSLTSEAGKPFTGSTGDGWVVEVTGSR